MFFFRVPSRIFDKNGPKSICGFNANALVRFCDPKRLKAMGPHNIDICSLIFGSLLGDSYGEKRNGSTRFILQQEESNVTYLMWFHKYLATRGYCCPKKPILKTRIGAGGKVRFFCRIRTYSFASFNWIYDAFYSSSSPQRLGKKLPKDLTWTLLTPLALAIWIMDDGTYEVSGVKIVTNCFEEEDVLFLCFVLNKKYNLYAQLHRTKERNKFIVYIPKAGMPQLGHLISAYLVPSMHRKLNGYYFV